MKSVCGHSAWVCLLANFSPSILKQINNVCVRVSVCGHATGVNPWQRADNSQQAQRERLDRKHTNILPHSYTVMQHQAFFYTPKPMPVPKPLSYLYTLIHFMSNVFLTPPKSHLYLMHTHKHIVAT